MSQKRIIIRTLRLGDVDDIYELMHMPNVLWGASLLPSQNVDSWKQTIEQWNSSPSIHTFVAELQGKVVGVCMLNVGDGRSRHMGRLAMAVHDKFQGQGIGKMLMLTLIDLADNWLNLLRIELEVFVDNERALRLYKSFDFEIEGRKRFDSFRSGVYVDSYVMARLRLPGGINNSSETGKQPPSLTGPSGAQDAQ